MKPHILLIDDSEAVQAAISSVLSNREYVLTTVSRGADALACLEHQGYDLILLDYSLPDIDGLHLLRTLVKKNPDIPVIMVTGSGSERLAVQALKSGASDYLVKTSDFISKLPHVVRDNLDKYDMRRRNRELESQVRESYKQLKQLNRELEAKVQARTEELERAYQLSNELMAKAVDSNMQLAELYSEVDESRRKLDAKIRELSLLNEVGKIMASTLDRDTLLKVTIDSAHQELGVDHCAILLLDEQNSRFTIGVSRGTPDDLFLAAKSMDGEHILFDVLRKGEPLLVQDVESAEDFGPLIKDFPAVESFMLVPMRVKHYDIGMFTLYGFEQHETFTQGDLDFISSLASQASIAFANILLTNQRIQEEQIGMLGKMTNYIVREVKNSLLSIRNTAETMVEQDFDIEQRQQRLQGVVQDIDLIMGTVQELLEFSYGQHGTLKLQTCSIQEFVDRVVATLTTRFAGQHISIEEHLDYGGDLQCDRDKMTRIFLNIAENARNAMPEGGKLIISNHLADNMVHFEFVDDGYGISPELSDRIFEPFVSEGKVNGAGLGLTIVKKILDEHHAHIDIHSVITKGTTVHLSIPLTQRAWEEEKELGAAIAKSL